MLKTLLSILFLSFNIIVFSQNYNPVINYNFNGTPTNGVKIKTNLPFTNSSQMPTIIIEGFSYGNSSAIGLIINYYIYNGNFINHSISSFGNYLPKVSLAQENGKVVIFLDEKHYFTRFTIRSFAQGMGSDTNSSYVNWTIVDEQLTGSNITNLNYKNSFGQINFINGIVNSQGRIGIGTRNPDELLTVKGKIHANEIKVDLTVPADYVFQKYFIGNSELKPEYEFKSLEEIKSFIKDNHHLPGIPSANKIQSEGIMLGEMNNLLLEKIEELTLHIIQLNERIKTLENK